MPVQTRAIAPGVCVKPSYIARSTIYHITFLSAKKAIRLRTGVARMPWAANLSGLTQLDPGEGAACSP